MADIPVFEAPSFLYNQDAYTIQQRMLSRLPSDIDAMQGGFAWDLTMPTALEKAEMLEFHLRETIKLMHPMWAYGRWLDYHGIPISLPRKASNAAAGILHVTGIPGTRIGSGFRFAVPAVNDQPAIEYETAKDAIISEDGVAEIDIVAIIPGPAGNVPEGTVSLMVEPMRGITGIVNPNPITGGAEEENDESYRDRIMEVYAVQDTSFVGCDADYIRWAKEVPGVGNAFVIPEWQGPGTVKVIIIDINGLPANNVILQNVYEHIISPKDRILRKAPIGASVTVAAPVPKEIRYSVKLFLYDGASIENVLALFKKSLQKYYITANEQDELRYHQVEALLTGTEGVYDFHDFFMDGKRANIFIAKDEYPVTAQIDAVL